MLDSGDDFYNEDVTGTELVQSEVVQINAVDVLDTADDEEIYPALPIDSNLNSGLEQYQLKIERAPEKVLLT